MRAISFTYQLTCILLYMVLMAIPLTLIGTISLLYVALFDEELLAFRNVADVFVLYFDSLVAEFVDEFYPPIYDNDIDDYSQDPQDKSEENA